MNLSCPHILGQDIALTELREEMLRGRMNHSYLFEGPDGTGRMTLAQAFAAAVLLGDDFVVGDDDPAGMIAARLNRHPDYLELPREATSLRIRRFVEREGSSTEKIEHTPVMPFLQLKPVMAERRICVIPDAERMEIAAANTFLKTLEEPPGNALILLTTSARDRMLPTIVSRCRRVRVCPLSDEQIAAELETRGLALGEQARDLAVVAEGSLGTALRFADGEVLAHWEWIRESLQHLTPVGAVEFAKGLIARAASAGSSGLEKRRAAGYLLDLIALHIRRELRSGLDPRAAEAALASLWTAGEELAANVRMELVIHSAVLNTVAALRRG